MTRKSVRREIPHSRVSPLGAVVTQKVRIINDFSFEVRNRAKKAGLSEDTDPDIIPHCLCATSVLKLREELVFLQQKCPAERILMGKADV